MTRCKPVSFSEGICSMEYYYCYYYYYITTRWLLWWW